LARRRLCASGSTKLNALVCYEVGKTWVEADADIAETIDFLEFYGREMLRLGEPQKLTPIARRAQLPGVHSAGRGRSDSAVEFFLARLWRAWCARRW